MRARALRQKEEATSRATPGRRERKKRGKGSRGQPGRRFNFSCSNTNPAPFTSGLNTLLLGASATPTPDIVALGATPSGDGIMSIPGPNGTGFFSVATVNVGASSQITVQATTSGVTLPIFVCQTDPVNGACIDPPAASVSTQINAGETPTFAAFAAGNGITVPLDPASTRATMWFLKPGGITVGATSAAIETLTQ